MLLRQIVPAIAAVLGAYSALPTSHTPAPDCVDGCEAIAHVIAIPALSCGQDIPAWTVSWGSSTSGDCDDCTVVSPCDNMAVLTVTPTPSTYLNGGGFACSGTGDDLSFAINDCGEAHTWQIMVHSATPCQTSNQVCTIYATIGCKNC